MSLLIDDNVCIPVGMVVYPAGLVYLHIDAAMATIEVEGRSAARVIMWELCPWTKVLSPPGIVYEEAAPVVENRVVNGRWWIPERRTRRFRRFELVR